jgi:hypothetical protein
MKKLFVLVVFVVGLGQVFAQQEFTKVFPRPAWCQGSGAIVNDITDEVLVRVDEPMTVMVKPLTLMAQFRQINGKIYLVTDDATLYAVDNLSVRWQKVANVDNRFLRGEDFSWTHYGHWLYKRPLKSFFK